MEQSQAVGAHTLVVLRRGYEVSFGLRHFGSVHADHALGKESLERFSVNTWGKSRVDQRFCEEARIEKVQNRVFNSPDVLINRHPLCGGFWRKRNIAVKWVSKTKVIPTRVDKRVHGVGFPLSSFAANRTRDIDEFFMGR